jgi:hypothetical protein
VSIEILDHPPPQLIFRRVRDMSVSTLSLLRMRSSDEVPTANIVPTPAALTQMLNEKPSCWRFAAFASILFQRWATVEERRVRAVLGHRADPSQLLGTDHEVVLVVLEYLRASDDLVREVDVFMRAPAFMGVFGDPSDEGTADADGIVRTAHRLMDYYERLLELAEQCRDCSVPSRHAELLRDCAQLMNLPLRDFGDFIDDVLVRFEELRANVARGHDDVWLEPVLLRTTTANQLVWSILDRLNEID